MMIVQSCRTCDPKEDGRDICFNFIAEIASRWSRDNYHKTRSHFSEARAENQTCEFRTECIRLNANKIWAGQGHCKIWLRPQIQSISPKVRLVQGIIYIPCLPRSIFSQAEGHPQWLCVEMRNGKWMPDQQIGRNSWSLISARPRFEPVDHWVNTGQTK